MINISVEKAIKTEPASTITDELRNKTENSCPQQQEETIEMETLDIDEAAEPKLEQDEVSDDGLDVDKDNERDVVSEKQTK